MRAFMRVGNPVAGGRRWGSVFHNAPLVLRADVVPPALMWWEVSSALERCWSGPAGCIARSLALVAAAPAAAAGPNVLANTSLTSSPEPSTLAMLAVALAVLFLFRRFAKTG